LERGVRPIGDWSMLMTLSRYSSPSTSLTAPAFSRLRYSRWLRVLCRVSITRVDLPDPETPVTQVMTPRGISIVISLRLFSVAPTIRSCFVAVRRLAGTAMESSPDR